MSASRKPPIHFNVGMVINHLRYLGSRLRTDHTQLRSKVAVFIGGPGESLYTESVYRPGFRFGCAEHTEALHSAQRVVDYLFELTEASEAFVELLPAAKVAIDAYAADFKRWRRMRHDIRHSFERLYRDEHPMGNAAFVSGCQGYWAGHYDFARDTFVTGKAPEGRLELSGAVDRAEECIKALCVFL
jgi:hypothetical protein